jgi:hypothetical protein
MSIYIALYNTLKTLNSTLGLATSSFQNERPTRYTYIEKLNTELDTLTSTLTRLENHYYRINYYGHNFINVTDNLHLINKRILTLNFSIANYKHCETEVLRRHYEEVDKGFYHGSITYLFVLERQNTGYTFGHVRALDMYSCLNSRFNGSVLSTVIPDFITTKYTNKPRPYLYIPNYEEIEFLVSTSDGTARTHQVNFSIGFEHGSIASAELALEEIDKLYSYATFYFTDTNKRFMNLSWQGNSLMEIEPFVWEGKVNYQLVQ